VSESATDKTSHITVCICSYKRPAYLTRLLNELAQQNTKGHFTYSLVVCDNDYLRSAEPIVSQFAATSAVAVKYCVEPRQNIALARNKAVQNAKGDYVAFIDDDEFPERTWLLDLYEACNKYGVDGVLGPVKPFFVDGVPRWVVKGRFYEKPWHDTGFVLAARNTRTSNVLLKDYVLRGQNLPFRPEFRAGEDIDFFTRAIEQGRTFVWCNEAVVYEEIPPSRWKRSYLLRKALLRGTCAALRPTVDLLNVAKSVLAILIYSLALPFAALLGQHRFMDLLVRLCDHLGKVLAVAGINSIKEPYVAG
jgi:succinoglycan biosynthesis protein ExoM